MNLFRERIIKEVLDYVNGSIWVIILDGKGIWTVVLEVLCISEILENEDFLIYGYLVFV